MDICLLTYDVPHRKTNQVFGGLATRGFHLDFLLMPFVQRSKRDVMFEHRPEQFIGASPQSLAAEAGGHVHQYADWRRLHQRYDYFIVCGSNIIEPEFANSGKVLNVHAGLIPAVRGLDSFKWTILNGQPMGNTLHRINEETDAGEVIAYQRTPVYPEDDLQTLAERHYQNEIAMLTNFDALLVRQRPALLPLGEPTKRMPIGIEGQMMRAFEAYKNKFAAAT